MARRRMVTRTINFTKAEVMTLNVETAEVSILEYRISGTFDNETDLLKALKKAYETDYLKLAKVSVYETEEVLFGMDEKTFMDLAEVLPPRTVALNDDNE